MPRLGDMFPSNYLKASDFEDGDEVLTIKSVSTERIGPGKDEKWVVYFREKTKGLVLNKTNAGVISELYGEDTDAWEGMKVTLFSMQVDFQGKQVDSIRIKNKRPKEKEKASKVTTATVREPGSDDDEGDPPY